ncbi:FAD-dependent monooxygenase [Roseivivax marinus]|uniref:FAD-dependent monooxygenase n=1 Tax=Roseivivax marinus TaxID=1379903 RepID=UPI001F04B3B2|nr:FAD-dependent monooxygenase [Roseivivax marinus]UMA64409.1 FAD-dependent monooxygenase [Roseivivax marinus]
MASDKDAQVIISGGGPVGMALAIELGQRGISVLVLEKYPEPQRIPKGQNLTPRTMEHFRAWGAETQLRAARPVPAEFGIGGLTAYGTLLGDYHYDWLKRELVRPYYAADNERLPQYETEAVLRARAVELDAVTLRTGVEVDAAKQDETGVTVTAHERASGAGFSVRANYAVGCDGARSPLRVSAGLTQTVRDHDRQMVLLVFQSEALHKALLDRHPGKSFFNVLHPDLEGYWLFFGRVDLEGEFFFHAPMPAGADKESFNFQSYVESAVGAEIDMDVRHRGFWDCRVAIADDYGNDRIFVAGDAAHNHPPYGGYGINTGFEDARNLGWKLAARLQGWGGSTLLGSYDAERRPVFASTATDFIEASIATDRAFLKKHDPVRDRASFEDEWAGRATGAASEVGSYQPNYRGSPIVAGARDGSADAIAEHRFEARAGYHLAPRTVPSGGTTFDHLGSGFTLLALGADGHAGTFAEAARALSIPLDVVPLTREGALEDYGASLVLVRPDHFVSWSGDDSSEAAEILRLATGKAA